MQILGTIGIPIVIVGLAVAVFGILVFFARNYKKCAPNEVLVVYGRKRREVLHDGKTVERGYRLITGGATFVVPVLEAVERLSLNTFQVEFSVTGAPNKDGVMLNVEALANVKIASDPTQLSAAVERLLGSDPRHGGLDLQKLCRTTLEGQLRLIVGTLTVEEIVREREKMAQQVLQLAQAELTRLGISIDNFTIQKVTDAQGYIEALGKKRTAEVKRDAEIGEAEALREATIKASTAKREGEQKKLDNDAQIAAAQRDLEVKKADYKVQVETAQAKANLARQLQEAEIQQDLKRKLVAVEEAEVKARIAVAEQQAQRTEKELVATTIRPAEATRDAAVIKAEGDAKAAVRMAQAEAEATKARAEATKVQLAAEGEGHAAADAAQRRQIGLAEAEATKAKGEAEGAAIAAKLLAEALGLQKKNEALAQMSEGARMIIVLERLPEIIDQVGEAGQKIVGSAFEHVGAGLSRIDNLHIIDMGNGTGANPVERFALSIPGIVFKTLQQAKTLGVNLDELLGKFGINAEKLMGALTATPSGESPEAGKGTHTQ